MKRIFGALCCAPALAAPALADELASAASPMTLPTVEVRSNGAASSTQKYQLPVTTESLDGQTIAETVNAVDSEDAFKYLPGVFVRKRNAGDTQAPLATRTSGPEQSARSLVYADGILLSALIGNNNTNASPRWGMVAPEEIERIDLMYAPFAAAYPGNSIGAVAEITTRMPQSFEGPVKTQASQQDFSLYGTQGHFNTGSVLAMLGDRQGDLSWRVSVNHLDAYSQPVTLATATPTAAAGVAVNGGYAAGSRTGTLMLVVGAGGLEHKQQDTFKTRLAYDITPIRSAPGLPPSWRRATARACGARSITRT